MGNIITIQVPDTDANKAVIASLIGIPGVKIETGGGSTISKEYVSLQEGAQIAKVNYYTFRKWVIEKKMIPYERPSGAKQGGVRMLVANIEAFLEGRDRKKSTRGGRVKVLD